MNYSPKNTILTLFLFVFQLSFSQTTLQGLVTDQNNQPLFGANIIISDSYNVTTTDENGRFTLRANASLPLTLEVSFIGFTTQIVLIETSDALVIRMEEGTYFDEVIVSASRRLEKLQEAPAAVSVIRQENINASGGSILLYRMKSEDPGMMMPEIGRSIVHQEGVALIEEYIKNLTIDPVH